MSATKGDAKWPLIVNLSNSIIGVSILAMPFCFQNCGILLGALLLAGSNIMTRITAHLLMKGAHLSRKRSYEFYAGHVMGPMGKMLVEVMMIFFLFSTLCAFFVVVGDLGPHIIADIVGLTVISSHLRAVVMILIAIWIILPLSLLRNIDSLSQVSSLAIIFYGIFVVRIIIAAVPDLLSGSWFHSVNWWRPGGVLECLPIFALSLSCQTQLFITADSMMDPSPGKMDTVLNGAVNLCSIIYLLVGIFGYIAFHGRTIGGDLLVYLDQSLLTVLIRLLFMLSVAVSFPLMLFPCRTAIYTMLFKTTPQATHDITIEVMPEASFRLITISILFANLCIGIVIPNVEFVLSLTGSSVGSFICIVLPCALFLYVAPEHQFYSRILAQICFFAGLFMMIVCTFAVLRGGQPAVIVEGQPIPTQLAKNVSLALGAVVENPDKKIVQEQEKPIKIDPVLRNDIAEHEKRLEPPIPVEKLEEETKEGENEEKQAQQKPPNVSNVTEKSKEEVQEAAKLVKELKEQQKEQKQLLQEQKQLIQELKDQKNQNDAEDPAKGSLKETNDAIREVPKNSELEIVKEIPKQNNQEVDINRLPVDENEKENANADQMAQKQQPKLPELPKMEALEVKNDEH